MLANPSGNDFHWVLNWLFTVVTCISIDSAVSWWCKKRALLQNTQKTSRARNPLLCRRRRKHVVQWSILFFLFNIFLQSGSPQKPSQPMPPTSSRLISKPITSDQKCQHRLPRSRKYLTLCSTRLTTLQNQNVRRTPDEERIPCTLMHGISVSNILLYSMLSQSSGFSILRE